MSRVLLINPSIKGSMYQTPCLGLGYIGASLKKAGHDVTVIDGCLSNVNVKRVVSLMDELRPDCIGVTGFTLQYPTIREIFPAVKQLNPHITTVFGGQHASALTEYVMKETPEIDFTIKGEGENAFPALLAALSDGGNLRKIDGLAFRENGGIVVNPRAFLADLDGLELPWKVINPLDYTSGMGHGFMAKRRPVAPVISSRGCPYKCSFCGGFMTLGRKLRLREPEKFVDEIEYLINNYGIREVHIVDDNFTFYKEHAAQVCEDILKRKLDISWSLPNGIRADSVDYPLLQLMKEAGCYYTAFGIEFGSERMLKLTHKQLSLDTVKKTVAMAHKLGYITHGFFIMGHPQEKQEDIEATIDVARKMPLDRMSVTFMLPLPGSEIFDYYLQKDYLNMESVNWEQFAGPQYIPRTEFLTYHELIRLLRIAYVRFYLNPRRVLSYLFKLRSLSQIKGLVPGVKTLFSSIVRRGKWWNLQQAGYIGGYNLANPSVSIIIPTLNEMENLPHVLPVIPDLPEIKELILVDGLSTDDTIKVARELVPAIKVILQTEKGKGAAMKYAWEKATGDILVTLDADGSISPREIPQLIKPLLNGCQLTKGSRFLPGGGTVDMPPLRRIGNWIFTTMTNILFGTKYTDLVYGFHAFRREVLEKIDIESGSFAIDTELYLKVKKAGLKVEEVPSFESRRIYGSGKLRSLSDGWKILNLILKERFHG